VKIEVEVHCHLLKLNFNFANHRARASDRVIVQIYTDIPNKPIVYMIHIIYIICSLS